MQSCQERERVHIQMVLCVAEDNMNRVTLRYVFVFWFGIARNPYNNPDQLSNQSTYKTRHIPVQKVIPRI